MTDTALAGQFAPEETKRWEVLRSLVVGQVDIAVRPELLVAMAHLVQLRWVQGAGSVLVDWVGWPALGLWQRLARRRNALPASWLTP